MAEKSDRRAFLNKTLLGAAGLGAAYSLEEKILLTALEGQAAEVGPPKAEPAGSLPHGKIGNVSISRLFLGGNLIGGWAHSRDLMYVSQLFKAYNTEAKIFETLAIAEQHGINTVLIDPVSQNVVEKYKRQRGGKIQTMVCIPPTRTRARWIARSRTSSTRGRPWSIPMARSPTRHMGGRQDRGDRADAWS